MPLVRVADGKAVLRVVIAPSEDLVAQRFDDEALEQFGILRAWPEEPGAEGIPWVVGHGAECGGGP